MPAYSGLWNGVYAENYALQVVRPPTFRCISMALRRRSLTVLREVLDTVANGSSINGAAAVTFKRASEQGVPGSSPANGGVRTIDTVTRVNAGTTVGVGTLTAPNVSAAQVDGLVDYKSFPSTYPADAAGNGGGGRLTAQYPVNG
jgi:hypothetical protein